MRSMSLGLIKGTIDEVEQNVNVTWIQPRVLDRHHIEMLCAQIDDWSARFVYIIKYVYGYVTFCTSTTG
jgi:26S proteasome regulatory subunit N9